MTRASDELPQTGVVAEQTDPAASNTFIDNQLTENNDGQWSPQDAGQAESGKTEEKVVTLVKKVKDSKKTIGKVKIKSLISAVLWIIQVPVPYPVTKHGVYQVC